MSSFLGHALAGATLYFSEHPADSRTSLLWGGLVVALAMLPDCDYPVFWLLGLQIEPRITHSLGFCLLASLAAGWLLRFGTIPKPLLPSSTILIAAPLSHLALDLLVGVHPMPLFWPLSSTTYRLPFGILPSAGKISLFNYFLWRNLAIEMGIIVPIAWFYFLVRRRAWRRTSRWSLVSATSVWIGCLVWGISLPR